MKYNYRIFYMHFFAASITEILIALIILKWTTISIPIYIYFMLLLYNLYFSHAFNKRCRIKEVRKILRERRKANEEFLHSRFPDLGNKYKSYIESD